MKPTVGRIVHFVQQHSPEHLAAVVCAVLPPGAHRSHPEKDGTLLNLGMWSPAGHPSEGVEGVPEDQIGKRANSWHWPEREEPDEDETEESE